MGIENIWIEITLKCHKKLLVGLFYRSPNTNAAADQSIENSIDLASNTGLHDIVILGDFNLNTCNCKRKLEALCTQYGLTQCVEEPTHFTENSQSILNIILVKQLNPYFYVELLNPSSSKIVDTIVLYLEYLHLVNQTIIFLMTCMVL